MNEQIANKNGPSNLKGSSGNKASTKIFESFTPEVRKELNIYGKMAVLGVYSVICAFLGAFVVVHKHEDKHHGEQNAVKELRAQVEQQLKTLREGQDMLGRAMSSYNAAHEDDIENVKLKVKNSSLNERTNDLIRKEIKKQLKLSALGISEQYKELNRLKRRIASISNEAVAKEGIKIPYSIVNFNILSSQQRLEIKEMRGFHNQELKTFSKNFPLSEGANDVLYQKLINKHKMEISALNQKQQQQRVEFMKNKFTLVKSNFELYEK